MEISLLTNLKQAQERAESNFKKKERQAAEGAIAIAEYEAQGRAIRERTARLRALRLAKEAAEGAAEATKKPRAIARRKQHP
jgi:hypothetical protein